MTIKRSFLSFREVSTKTLENNRPISSRPQTDPAMLLVAFATPMACYYEVTTWVCAILPIGKSRYLMGVGTPQDLLECIAIGVDMFDCVMPTRNGRNGMLFTTQGIINIKNRKWKTDFSPIDKHLGGHVSTYYTKAYLNHLFHAKELLGAQLASTHNLALYRWLTQQARLHIAAGTFRDWKSKVLKVLVQKI